MENGSGPVRKLSQARPRNHSNSSWKSLSYQKKASEQDSELTSSGPPGGITVRSLSVSYLVSPGTYFRKLPREWAAINHLLRELRAKQPDLTPGLTTIGASTSQTVTLVTQPVVTKETAISKLEMPSSLLLEVPALADFNRAWTELTDWLSLLDRVIKSQRVMVGDLEDINEMIIKQKATLQDLEQRCPQLEELITAAQNLKNKTSNQEARTIITEQKSEVYQRQVLSISCIIFGIVIVGMFCAAFYFKSKKQTKQIQEQLKESQNGKNYSLKASSMMSKSESLVKSHVQLQNYSKAERHPVTALEKMMESSFGGPQPFPEVPSPDRGSQSVKHHRSFSSCCSPGQRSGMLHRNAFRRIPPSPRSRLGGVVRPTYQQLEESRIPDQDTIPCQRYSSSGLKTQQNSSINMQLPSRETNPYFNNLDQKDLVGYSSTRASSVPIIPSVGLEETCMQMPGISEVKSIKWCKNSYSADIVNVSIPVSDCFIAEQQEVKILLETVQEQIQILTDARQSEDYKLARIETEDSASENTAFLPLSPTAKSEREAQFVLRNEIQGRRCGSSRPLVPWSLSASVPIKEALADRKGGGEASVDDLQCNTPI
ncbi:pro-neuregulin-3, membrane-bound isoform-like [Erethizon dorsatum]